MFLSFCFEFDQQNDFEYEPFVLTLKYEKAKDK